MCSIISRQAGVAQAVTLIGIGMLPTLAIVSLVPNLSQLFGHFRDVPNHELLVPMVLTVPSLCIALFAPVAGWLTDRWGRRRLLLISLVFYSVVGLLPLVLDNLYQIIASRFVVGLAEAAILTVGNALLGDYFEGEERRKWLGWQTIAGPVIASLLVLAGGALATRSWHGPFVLYALGLVVLFFSIIYIWEPRSVVAQAPTMGRNPEPLFPWGATVLMGAVTIAIAILYYVQAVQLGRIFGDLGVATPWKTSIMVTIASVGIVLGGWAYHRIARASVPKVIALILLAYGIGYLGLSRSPDYLVGLPFAVIAQFGNGLTIPALVSWALSQYDFAHRGRGMGFWGSCFFLSQFLSPPVVLSLQHFTGTFLAAVGALGVLCLLAAAGVFVGSRVRAAAPSRAERTN
jgi:MFS family permease